MNKKSIDKLRRRFILIALLSFTCVMSFIGGLVYAINIAATRHEAFETLNLILDNNGELITAGEKNPGTLLDKYLFLSKRYQSSPEFSYQTRYFYVTFDNNMKTTDLVSGHIAALSEAETIEYAKAAVQSDSRFHRRGNYYYLVHESDSGTEVAFLDCRSQFYTNTRILFISLLLTIFGAAASFLILRVFSFRVIQPEIRNMQRQKQFITNASHELKTPLAVIRANTELDVLMNGENEWNQSTMRQVDHMTDLIQNLVTIAKYQEKSSGIRVDTDFSKAVSESAESFRAVAEHESKTFTKKIPDGIHMEAEPNQISQLTALLVDNAIKYCDDNGEITVELSQKGRYIRLIVSNSYKEGANQDYRRFFDRFYRENEAHTQGSGGYGIGLSIAESLMEQYRGSIDVSWKDGIISFTCTFKNM
jgi:two-component system sensor histidine kinase CiaH